jgi:hypothetical protein
MDGGIAARYFASLRYIFFVAAFLLLFIYSFIYIPWILTWLEILMDMEIVKSNRTNHKNYINT